MQLLKAEIREKVGLPNREVIVFDFEKQSFSDLRDLTKKYFVYIGKGLYLTQIILEKEQLNLHRLRTRSGERPINTGFSVVFTESGKYYLDNVFGGLCADLEMFDSSDDFGMFSVGWHEPRYIFRDLIDDQRVNMGIGIFTGGTADIRMIKKDLYSVVIRSANENQIAELKIDDNLEDSWYGFKVGDEEYDINIYSGELFGTGDAKWGATVYPVKNGLIDTGVYVQLNVREV